MTKTKVETDIIIIGAGASGLMAAVSASNRGRKIVVLEKRSKPGNKITIAGGGYCNFTNLGVSADNFICSNKHFVKPALAAFSQNKIIDMVIDAEIPIEEREAGRLFIQTGSSQILQMLLNSINKDLCSIIYNSNTISIKKEEMFFVETDSHIIQSVSLIVASGGQAYPQAGGTDFALKTAVEFGHTIIKPEPGLTPLILGGSERKLCTELSGISHKVLISFGKHSFKENLLFTFTGFSGPAALQISNYVKQGNVITINWLPKIDLVQYIYDNKNSNKELKNFLSVLLPARLAEIICQKNGINKKLSDLKKQDILLAAELINRAQYTVAGKDGFDKAETTLGGIDTKEINPKTMESKTSPNLYFTGEALDVAGQLGGYNLQWAWSSGYTAGLHA